MTLVKTKSAYDPPEESDGERILVSRYWPRGLSKEHLSLTDHLKDVAPSIELLKDWKASKISWAEYEKRYYQEMAQRQQQIKKLAEKAANNTITLLCFEREDNPHCHRHLLKRMIEEYE